MKVWIDGEIRAAEEAKIGIFDRAVLFGESIYEGVRICGGRAPMLERHRRRLAAGLAAIGLDAALADRLDGAVSDLLHAEPVAEGLLYLQVTGGGVPGIRRHARGQGDDGPGRIFAFITPGEPVPETPMAVRAVRTEDRRWRGCGVKTTNLLANVLALTQADRAGAEEAVLIADGRVAEGAYTSVFVVRNDVLHTTPTDADPPILPGVTREVLIERLAANGVPIREQALPASCLDDASEILIPSSRRLVSAVTALDGAPVGTGTPGPVARRCLELLREAYLGPGTSPTRPSESTIPTPRQESTP